MLFLLVQVLHFQCMGGLDNLEHAVSVKEHIWKYASESEVSRSKLSLCKKFHISNYYSEFKSQS